jgi:hypothetical protein
LPGYSRSIRLLYPVYCDRAGNLIIIAPKSAKEDCLCPFSNDTDYFEQDDDGEFEKLYKPGQQPKYSGIYRCEECHHEVVIEKERKCPPEPCHKDEDSPLWRLIVRPKPPKANDLLKRLKAIRGR